MITETWYVVLWQEDGAKCATYHATMPNALCRQAELRAQGVASLMVTRQAAPVEDPA